MVFASTGGLTHEIIIDLVHFFGSNKSIDAEACLSDFLSNTEVKCTIRLTAQNDPVVGEKQKTATEIYRAPRKEHP